MPLGDRATFVLIGLFALNFLGSLILPKQVSYQLAEMLTLAFVLLTSTIVTFANQRRIPYGTPFGWAWGILGVGFVTYALSVTGFIPTTILTPFLMPAFCCLQVVILSLCIGEKMKNMQRSFSYSEALKSAAKSAQRSFTPKDEVPQFLISEHITTADSAGGDLYGYHYLEDEKCLFFYIGDVTGHGIDS